MSNKPSDKNPADKDIDEPTGVETTGHEWDGIKELNNPTPRWWLIVWMITIVWAIGYWVVYPAWPTINGHTKGIAGWTQYGKLEAEKAQIDARQGEWLTQFRQSDFATISANPEIYEFARAGGEVAFKENCAACHGAGGEGKVGYPNLNDDDWLYSGTVEGIHHTLKVGIRSGHPEAHITQMPAYGPMLKVEEIDDLATYVIDLAKGDKAVKTPAHVRGEALFAANCVTCHGEGGVGDRNLGAPRLNDAIWLYGGDRDSVVYTITHARAGVMPTWENRLSEDTLRQLAIYVHGLGGGE